MENIEDAKRFGSRLKQLRIETGLTQRALAAKVEVDFTYLSKIENGILPPPSEKVINSLAGALNTDRDELIVLAGKIPSDIAEMLKDHKTLKKLRAESGNRETNPVSEKKGAFRSFEGLSTMITAHKNWARVVFSASLAVLFGVMLWFSAPTSETAIAANNQGVSFNNSEEYTKGIEAFNKAIKLDPGFALAYNNRGWAYLELGQYEQAITDCTMAIDLDPKLALAYSNRGLAYVKLGRYEQAVADCTKAIELDPGLALAYSNRGLAYISLGYYEQAISDFDRALALDPTLQK
ncbi:MAG: tetratricopeptide repeat protein [Dehalococcoidales bacterium]|nr:tetratricopeptide repeat protein [Dehalococcoidales bacterium]